MSIMFLLWPLGVGVFAGGTAPSLLQMQVSQILMLESTADARRLESCENANALTLP